MIFKKIFVLVFGILIINSNNLCNFAHEPSHNSFNFEDININCFCSEIERSKNSLENSMLSDKGHFESNFLTDKIICCSYFKNVIVPEFNEQWKNYLCSIIVGNYRLNFYHLPPIEEFEKNKTRYEYECRHFLTNNPINICLYNANIEIKDWQETMEKTVDMVKGKNLNGYIIFVPLNCEKLSPDGAAPNNENEAGRILNIMDNYVSEYLQDEYIRKEYGQRYQSTKFIACVEENFIGGKFFCSIIDCFKEYCKGSKVCILL